MSELLENRKTMQDILNRNEVKVIFLKKDGSLRTMKCTRNFDIMQINTGINEESLIKGTGKESEDVLKVFDLEKSAWRSFRVDSVQSIEVVSRTRDLP